MDKKRNVSMAVIKRLPKYHRYLEGLMKNDMERISSKDLGDKMGFTASQIRQDLNCFGDFGQQGYGYNVIGLYNQISDILGLTKKYNVVIVGAGNIGQALINYTKFGELGFSVVALFDINPKLIGLKINDIEVKDIDTLETYLQSNPIDIGIICVPDKYAQSVSDVFSKNKIGGIWNFAPVDLIVPSDTKVENAHLSDSLLTLTYLLNEN